MHIIQRQVLEIRTRQKADAGALQTEASRLWHDELCPILAEVLDRLAGPAEYLRIGRVEIDLGRIPRNRFREIREIFREKIAEALYRHADAAALPMGGVPADHATGATPFNVLPAAGPGNEWRMARADSAAGAGVEPALQQPVRMSPAQRDSEIVRYFLQYGILPWWSGGLSSVELEQKLESWVASDAFDAGWVAGLLHSQTSARYRLVYQFSDKSIARLVEVVAACFGAKEVATVLPQLSALFLAPLALAFPVARKRVDYWTSLIRTVAAPASAKSGPDEFVEHFLRVYAATLQQPWEQFVAALSNSPAFEDAAKNSERLARAMSRIQSQAERTQGRTRDSLETARLSDTAASIRPSWPSGPEATPMPEAARERPIRPELGSEIAHLSALEEGISVPQAGLILLAPFVPALFEQLQLSPGSAQSFALDDAHSARRVHLLQYLATGERGPQPEHLLPLPKILSGVPLAYPVPNALELDPAEITECDHLLHSAIEHWNALQSTSPTGLREAFLIRPGLLKKNDAEWLLQVERKAYDVLIERIPWTYTLVKFLWMPLPIRVEW